MKKWWLLYLRLPWDRRVLWGAAALSLVPMAVTLIPSGSSTSAAESAPAEVDTHIPKGFVLVPIEVQNYEALDSILGKFGVVDLFQGQGPEGTKQRLIMRNVHMLRAPRNPSHFAVLIRERDVAEVLHTSAPFTVIVKRPNETGTELVQEESSPRRSITYDGG